MNVTEKSAQGLTRTLEILVPASVMGERLTQKIQEIQPNVRLKGFRPGKVPASHIRKLYGESIMGDLVSDVLKETSQKALSDRQWRPAGQPDMKLTTEAREILKGQADLVYEMSFDLMPDFTPKDVTSIKLTRLKADPDEEEVASALNRLAENNKTYKPKAKTAKALKGDAVVIDFEGKIDGKPFEGGQADNTRLILGEGHFLPGFETQIEGHKKGDDVTVTLDFPKDYPAENLAGKTASFSVQVKGIEAPQKTQPDDALAQGLGLKDLEDLTKAVRTQLDKDYATQSRMKLKRQLLDVLDSEYAFDLPSRLVEQEFSQIWEQVEATKKSGELEEEDAKKTTEELKAEYRSIAERRVRLGLVLAEIGRLNTVTISDQELTQALQEEARRYPGREQEVMAFYRENPEAVARMRAPLYEEKVVDYILERAQVEDKKTDKETLFADDEEVPQSKGKKRTASKSSAKKTSAPKATSKTSAAKTKASASKKKAPARKKAAPKKTS